MSAPLRIAFAGTPAFAVPSLEALLASRHRVVGVYTQPDRPAGRGRRLQASPVKQTAAAHGVPVLQPDTLKTPEAEATLRDLAPDLVVVAAYGLMIPGQLLRVPPLEWLNVHASLLPRWRGAAPIHRALLAGDRETGITLMRVTERLDSGPMLAARATPISPDDTAGSLHDRLAQLGAELLPEALDAWQAGGLAPEPQDETRVTYAHKLEKSEARLDWAQPAAQLERQVRAFNPWPVAQAELPDRSLRVWAATLGPQTAAAAPGTVLQADADGIDVACGAGTLRLLTVQRPGGRPMPVRDYLNAHPLPADA